MGTGSNCRRRQHLSVLTYNLEKLISSINPLSLNLISQVQYCRERCGSKVFLIRSGSRIGRQKDFILKLFPFPFHIYLLTKIGRRRIFVSKPEGAEKKKQTSIAVLSVTVATRRGDKGGMEIKL